MKIGEIARKAGVTTSRIRFYEKRGIIPHATRNDNGYREYSPDLIRQLGFIEQAQKLGFTLNEIRDVEPGSGAHPVSCAVAVELLTQKLSAVDELIATARQRKKDIKALIVQLQQDDGAAVPLVTSSTKRTSP